MLNEIIEYLKSNILSLAGQIVMLLIGDCISNSESCTTYHFPKNLSYTITNIIILLFISILKFVLSYLNNYYNSLSKIASDEK